MKTSILLTLAACAAFFAGCVSENPISKQTPQQTQAAYNMPMQTDASGATQKHTATRNFNNTGSITYALLPNGAMVPVMSWGQGINSDFAANAVNGASVDQGRPVPVAMNGQTFQGPFGQGATINAIDRSNADNMPEQLRESMGGQNARLPQVAGVIAETYKGRALEAGAHYDGVAKIGDKVIELSGPILEAFSPYAAANGAIKQVVTVFDDRTGERQTAVVDLD